MPTVHIVPLRTRNPDGSTSTQHPTTATTQPFTTSLACCGAPPLSAGQWRACLGGAIGLELLCPSQAISAVLGAEPYPGAAVPKPLCCPSRAESHPGAAVLPQQSPATSYSTMPEHSHILQPLCWSWCWIHYVGASVSELLC